MSVGCVDRRGNIFFNAEGDIKFGNDSDSILSKKLQNKVKNMDPNSILYKMYICYYKEKLHLLNLTDTKEDIIKDFLNLSDSRLKTAIMDNVRILSLDENNISTPSDLRCFKMVRSLDLSNNKLRKMPPTNTKLKDLDIKYNKITSLPHYPKLKILEASHNRLVDIKYSKKLERLVLSHNPITKLADLPKLKHLNISNTNISKLNYDFPLLTYLDITYTNIKTIDCPDNEIEFLCAANSKLTVLPEMEYVREIYIQNTRVTNVPFYDSLEKLSLTEEQYHSVTFNNRYKINRMEKNSKTGIIIIMFEPQFER